jgi:hypothetical protein
MKKIVLMIAISLLAPFFAANAQLARYYRFDYYYPTVRIAFIVGEFQVVHQGGGIDTLQLKNFDYWRTLCGSSLADLSDSSHTSSFQSQTGDILSFFTDLLFYFSTYNDGAEISDTISYTVQLVDDSSGTCLMVLDTVGVYPMPMLDSLDRAIINKDTTVLQTYIIPAEYTGLSLSLRIGISFSGPDSLAAICRSDRGSENGVLLSEQSIAEMQYLEMLIDTLIAEGTIDTSYAKKVDQPYDRSAREFNSLRLTVNPNVANEKIVVSIVEPGKNLHTKIIAFIFGVDGKVIEKWPLNNTSSLIVDVSRYSNGQYYIVPFVDGRIHAGTQFTVVR